MLTESTEDYIKAIYALEKDKAVSTTDLAQKVSVAPASVTKMLKRLVENKLVNYESHKGVSLTGDGKKEALRIVRRHRLLELFLVEIMGFSWDEVHEEACKLEHHISDKFEDSLDKLLNFPRFGPHGDPIPNKNGELPFMETVALADIEAGHKVVVARVLNEEQGFLNYLEEVGLVPGKVIKILEKNKFGGTIRFHSDYKVSSIGYELSHQILVQDNLNESFDVNNDFHDFEDRL